MFPMTITVPTLFDDQAQCVQALREGIRLYKKGELPEPGQVLCAPTGAGKTTIAQHMMASAIGKGRRGAFLVDGRPLFDQTSRRFFEVGIDHGKIGDGVWQGTHKEAVIAMIQTLARLEPDRLVAFLNQFDVVFIDECDTIYKALASILHRIKPPYVGLSATPLRKGLKKYYGRLVQVATTADLLKIGRLCPIRVRPSVEIDMHGAPIINGEWGADDVQARGRRIIGDIVSTWVEETQRHFGRPVKTMCFSASIAHGEELCREFQKAGIDARQVTAHTPKDERERTMTAYRHGDFPIVVSVAALATGIDVPDVRCIIMARPYRKALGRVIQTLGRGMRTADAKDFCLVIDHSSNILGFYQQLEDFFANGVRALEDARFRDVTRKEKPPKDAHCPTCNFLIPPGSPMCPACGAERRRRADDIEVVPGKTIDLNPAGSSIITVDPVSKGKKGWKGTEAELWKACCTYAARWARDPDKGLRQAKAKYHELAGDWPPRHYNFSPGNYVPKAIQSQLDRNYRRWKKQQQGTAA